jgi:hypothetical protein
MAEVKGIFEENGRMDRESLVHPLAVWRGPPTVPERMKLGRKERAGTLLIMDEVPGGTPDLHMNNASLKAV